MLQKEWRRHYCSVKRQQRVSNLEISVYRSFLLQLYNKLLFTNVYSFIHMPKPVKRSQGFIMRGGR